VTEKPRLVLIVDDDEPIRMLEEDILRSAGYKVEQAGGSAAAIEKLKQIRPDLVLLDLLMPGIDGWGVLRFIRTRANPPRVLVVSGMREAVPPGDLAQCIAGYIQKPFDIGQLIKTCANVLAAPEMLSPASGSRKDARRTFVVETTLLSEDGTPLALGQLLQVSRHGFRLELGIAVKSGDPVRIAFRVPGREQPLQLSGRVCWRQEFTLGAEAEGLSAEDRALLQELVGSEQVQEEIAQPAGDLKSR
jgi:CheY-like chemotaxis protein